jgi:hypothetical protein
VVPWANARSRAEAFAAFRGLRSLQGIAAHKPGRINRFAARQYCALACAGAAEDNCNTEKFSWQKRYREATDFAATGL